MIGILALQGAFAEHSQALHRLGEPCFEIRQRADLERPMDGLIIPGGESTVIGKLLRELDLFDPIAQRIQAGLPVFGTCAGLILLAKEVVNDDCRGFAVMDIRVRRNAYGRQLGSFYTEETFTGIGTVPMTFIRAPYIEVTLSDRVEVLAETGGHIVAARQDKLLVTAFHPELTPDDRIHGYFLDRLVHGGPM